MIKALTATSGGYYGPVQLDDERLTLRGAEVVGVMQGPNGDGYGGVVCVDLLNDEGEYLSHVDIPAADIIHRREP
jgi:hypothetical protein